MKRWTVRWFFTAVSDRLWGLMEKPVRDGGAWVFRVGVDVARRVGALPKPRQDGDGMLVINLTSHFGDGVMLLPVLQAMHEANPGAAIDVACTRGVDSLFAAVPFVRRVYAAPLPSSPPLLLKEAIQRRLQIVRWYRSELGGLHPRVCLMPRWGDDLFASLYLAYLIGAPVRLAYDSTVDPYQRNAPQRDRMITTPMRGGQGLHEPLRFLHVAQAGGLIPQEWVFRTDVPSPVLQAMAAAVPWEPLRDRLGLPKDAPWIAMAPGASRPNKTWPADRWARAGEMLLAAGYHLVVLSGQADRVHAETIAAALDDARVHVVAGATSMVESIGLLSHAAAFLGNDSGPGHAAGALGVPSVILFASHRDVYPDHSLSPVRIRPMGPFVTTLHPEQLLDGCRDACVTDVPHCIATIPVEAATDAVLSLLQKRSAA